MRGLQGLRDYAASAIDPFLDNLAGAELSARGTIEDAIDDRVICLETSFDVRATRFYENGLNGYLDFTRSLVDNYADQIWLRPELGISRRSVANDSLMAVAAEAVTFGVFHSIDLYNDEDACPPEAVLPLYELARSHGLTLKAHVGEFGTADEVRRTAEALGLDEVQHGIAAAESADVMHWLADTGVRLHICPTSNVMLGSVASLGVHPIRELYDHGVEVTVNTDDLMVFGQSVSDEYMNLFNAGVLTADELDHIRETSVRMREA